MKVLWTNSAQSSVIDTEESRHSQPKGPICVSYTVFHDPVAGSSERIHNQKKRDCGISSRMEEGRGWLSAKVLRVSAPGRRKNREVFQEPVCDGGK